MRASTIMAAACVYLMMTGSAFSTFHNKTEESSSADESSSSSGDEDSGGFLDFLSPGTKTTVTSGEDSPDINEVQAEAYNGPKARIAVKRFTDKTGKGWYTGSIGDGMADQLSTALFNSNRFILLERRYLADVLQEQDLGASGRVKSETAASIGEIEGAELLIYGAVTEFDRGTSGTSGSVGGGLLGGILGAISGGTKSSHMAIDIRVVDAKTSRIVAATSVEGEATDVNLGGALGGYYGGGALGGSLSTWKNEPIEKALRATIQAAVEFIVSKTPPIYYRHGAGPSATVEPAPATPQPAAVTTAAPARTLSGVVRVKSATLNARGGPGSSHPVIFQLRQGDPLLVVQQNDKWIQIQTQTQQIGWVAGWLIDPDPSLTVDKFLGGSAGTTSGGASTIGAGTSATPAKSADDPMERLTKIKKLYDAGLITEDEYNTKKAEILEDL